MTRSGKMQVQTPVLAEEEIAEGRTAIACAVMVDFAPRQAIRATSQEASTSDRPRVRVSAAWRHFRALHDSPSRASAEQLIRWLREDQRNVRALDNGLTLWALASAALVSSELDDEAESQRMLPSLDSGCLTGKVRRLDRLRPQSCVSSLKSVVASPLNDASRHEPVFGSNLSCKDCLVALSLSVRVHGVPQYNVPLSDQVNNLDLFCCLLARHATPFVEKSILLPLCTARQSPGGVVLLLLEPSGQFAFPLCVRGPPRLPRRSDEPFFRGIGYVGGQILPVEPSDLDLAVPLDLPGERVTDGA
jgi:hypothetical protein